MKIMRIIDGEEYEFELSPQERHEAWRECDMEMKRAEVKYYKEQYMDYNPDITEEEIDEAFEDIVERYIENMEIGDYATDNWPALAEAYERVLE
jgi:hypothetical protein